MVAGGALYWVNESDIAICSDDATFFDPHVSYGMTAALEPSGLAPLTARRPARGSAAGEAREARPVVVLVA
jgi:hypothetical protein